MLCAKAEQCRGSILMRLDEMTIGQAFQMFGKDPSMINMLGLNPTDMFTPETKMKLAQGISKMETGLPPLPSRKPDTTVSRGRYNLSQEDKKYLVGTVWGEYRGGTPQDRQAAAEAVLKRLDQTPGATVKEIVANGQFSPWLDEGLRNKMLNLPEKTYNKILQDITPALEGSDITKGANYFHADYVSPKWASEYDKTAKVGNHIYYEGPPNKTFGHQRFAGRIMPARKPGGAAAAATPTIGGTPVAGMFGSNAPAPSPASEPTPPMPTPSPSRNAPYEAYAGPTTGGFGVVNAPSGVQPMDGPPPLLPGQPGIMPTTAATPAPRPQIGIGGGGIGGLGPVPAPAATNVSYTPPASGGPYNRAAIPFTPGAGSFVPGYEGLATPPPAMGTPQIRPTAPVTMPQATAVPAPTAHQPGYNTTLPNGEGWVGQPSAKSPTPPMPTPKPSGHGVDPAGPVVNTPTVTAPAVDDADIDSHLSDLLGVPMPDRKPVTPPPAPTRKPQAPTTTKRTGTSAKAAQKPKATPSKPGAKAPPISARPKTLPVGRVAAMRVRPNLGGGFIGGLFGM